MRTEEELRGQIDLAHVWKEANYKLWQDGVLENEKTVRERSKGNPAKTEELPWQARSKERIKRAEKALNELAEKMESKGYRSFEVL